MSKLHQRMKTASATESIASDAHCGRKKNAKRWSQEHLNNEAWLGEDSGPWSIEEALVCAHDKGLYAQP